jgi:hypothetical protein
MRTMALSLSLSLSLSVFDFVHAVDTFSVSFVAVFRLEDDLNLPVCHCVSGCREGFVTFQKPGKKPER